MKKVLSDAALAESKYCDLKIFATARMRNRSESTSSAIATATCQRGTPPMTKRVIITTGAVGGSMLSTVERVPCGSEISVLIESKVKSSGRENTKVDWLPSRKLGTIAPQPAIKLP